MYFDLCGFYEVICVSRKFSEGLKVLRRCFKEVSELLWKFSRVHQGNFEEKFHFCYGCFKVSMRLSVVLCDN